MKSPYVSPGLAPLKITAPVEEIRQLFIDEGAPKDFATRKKRSREYIWPRHLFRTILNKVKNINPSEMERMGLGDRCSIIHSRKFFQRMIETKDKEFTTKFNFIELQAVYEKIIADT